MAQPRRAEPPRPFNRLAHEEEEQSALEQATSESTEGALELSDTEQEEVERRASLRVVVVHEAIRKEGEDELRRPVSALAWSGLAAGLSMGFSLVTEGLFRSSLPDASWRALLAKLGYPVGFLIVVLGRQQLFTENTLTVILPLLTRRNWQTLPVAAFLGHYLAPTFLGNTIGGVSLVAALNHAQVVSGKAM